MDGVEALNNTLIIGMTNRKDLMDTAILRPGRIDVHLEIGLPDEMGRRQIFDIHTKNQRKRDLIASDVDFDALAECTKNYTGAEIKGVVDSAVTFCLG